MQDAKPICWSKVWGKGVPVRPCHRRHGSTHEVGNADGPIAVYVGDLLAETSIYKSALSRHGFMADAENGKLLQERWMWARETEACFMDVMEELRANYAETAQLWEAYKERLKNFRSEVKNDVASLEAAARKTSEAATRISKCYADVFAQLNGPAMQQAIDNAERLARALESIAHMQGHKLMFSVVEHHAGNGAVGG